MTADKGLVPIELIQSKIIVVRDEKVMIDRDLAELYSVETKQLKRAVRRNLDRFPADFMFELTREEYNSLRSHFGTSSWGGTRYLPMAFTEQIPIWAPAHQGLTPFTMTCCISSNIV
ncbi:MAG: ORF6N domain-containing protein [Desulfobacteraceae bacterium]|nr:ORF6N domain-containing protein [Desulfobacteraceae bacterium]